jgi:hypothetical protein
MLSWRGTSMMAQVVWSQPTRRITMRRHLSFANVTATLALFVSLGGVGYAAATIDGKDITNRSIVAKKIKKHTLTGSEINLSKLGKVPSASRADTAARAVKATNATNAAQASTASFATTALSASTATTASKLTGVKIVATASVDNPMHHLDTGIATCPTGLVATGGGAVLSGGLEQSLNTSSPSGHNAWVVDVNNNGAGDDSFSAYVVCIPGTAG